jgi:hypothetical protein
LFFRAIPEGILGFYAIYVFSGERINYKKLLLSGVLFGIITYLVRFLPIKFGVHTIISLIFFIFIAVQINRVHLIKAVTSCILYIVILFVAEAVTYPLIASLVGVPLESLAQDPVKIVQYGSSSLIFTFIIIVIISIIKKKYNLRRKSE